MDVVVTGASGNVGTAVLAALARDAAVRSITGVSRRRPAGRTPAGRWIDADVGRDDLRAVLAGADAVIHLAWAIQPSHDRDAMWRTNVLGTARVAEAAVAVGVPTLVCASSVGAYSPGPKDRAVDESWPRAGTPTSVYALHKAATETGLDRLEAGSPGTRIVRMRPGLTFGRHAASGIRRLFLGPLIPRQALRPDRIPLVPDIAGLRFQAVSSCDVARAYVAALHADVRGAFNVAAEPVLDAAALSRTLGARRLPLPVAAARAALSLSWRARLQPTSPGWLDMALAVPLMDTTRARRELGWSPTTSSTDALRDLLAGMAEGAGAPTPPLAPGAG